MGAEPDWFARGDAFRPAPSCRCAPDRCRCRAAVCSLAPASCRCSAAVCSRAPASCRCRAAVCRRASAVCRCSAAVRSRASASCRCRTAVCSRASAVCRCRAAGCDRTMGRCAGRRAVCLRPAGRQRLLPCRRRSAVDAGWEGKRAADCTDDAKAPRGARSVETWSPRLEPVRGRRGAGEGASKPPKTGGSAPTNNA